MPTDNDALAQPLPEGRFDGREAFDAVLRNALSSAAQQGWKEIVFCDSDFADWPLGERASIDALQAWCAGGRRLLMLAQRYDILERAHARFVPWRRMWDHLIECRALRTSGPVLSAEVPSAIWTPTWFAHRIDPERSRGVCSHEARARRELREAIDERWRLAKPAFPASTLGL